MKWVFGVATLSNNVLILFLVCLLLHGVVRSSLKSFWFHPTNKRDLEDNIATRPVCQGVSINDTFSLD